MCRPFESLPGAMDELSNDSVAAARLAVIGRAPERHVGLTARRRQRADRRRHGRDERSATRSPTPRAWRSNPAANALPIGAGSAGSSSCRGSMAIMVMSGKRWRRPAMVCIEHGRTMTRSGFSTRGPRRRPMRARAQTAARPPLPGRGGTSRQQPWPPVARCRVRPALTIGVGERASYQCGSGHGASMSAPPLAPTQGSLGTCSEIRSSYPYDQFGRFFCRL